jgi:2,3-dihydroxybenzoate decarboxylase
MAPDRVQQELRGEIFPMQTMKKIALGEHVLTPGFEEYWAPTIVRIEPTIYHLLLRPTRRLRQSASRCMDRAGIERSVLSLAGPGVQREPDTAVARRRAREG